MSRRLWIAIATPVILIATTVVVVAAYILELDSKASRGKRS